MTFVFAPYLIIVKKEDVIRALTIRFYGQSTESVVAYEYQSMVVGTKYNRHSYLLRWCFGIGTYYYDIHLFFLADKYYEFKYNIARQRVVLVWSQLVKMEVKRLLFEVLQSPYLW